MNNYESKQLEFGTVQVLTYVTMSTINVCQKLQSSFSLMKLQMNYLLKDTTFAEC